jgi:hypothetical protein
MELVRNVAFLLAVISAITFLVSLFIYKKKDVSWLRFFIAGPKTMLAPSHYLRVDRSHVPPRLFALTMLMFVIVWFASWVTDNP